MLCAWLPNQVEKQSRQVVEELSLAELVIVKVLEKSQDICPVFGQGIK